MPKISLTPLQYNSFVLYWVVLKAKRKPEANTNLRGLGELISYKFAQEGCSIAINYNSSADRAKAVAIKIEKDYGMKAVLIQGVSSASFHFSLSINPWLTHPQDMGLEVDCIRTVEEATSALRGLDIIISNAVPISSSHLFHPANNPRDTLASQPSPTFSLPPWRTGTPASP